MTIELGALNDTDSLVAFLLEWGEGLAPIIAVVLFVALLIQSIRLTVVRGAAGRRMAKHKRQGDAGEARARVLLEKRGYRIRGAQEGGVYRLTVDGQDQPIHLRADYIVTRKRKRYVAEVKSGVESVKVSGRGTRRQLLEYLFAFEVDGVLLVDMVENQIHEVEFPPLKSGS